MTELLPTLPPCFRHALHPPWGLRIHSTRAAAGQTPPLWPTPLVGTRSLDCGGRNKWARMAQCWRQHHQQFPAVKLTGCPEFNPIGSKRACGIISRTQGQEKSGAMGLGWCKGWPQEVSSHREFNPRDRSRSRFVVSVAGGNGWFKNLLLSKIEIPDVDLGGLDDDDEDMNGDGDGDGDGDEGEGEGEGEGDDEDDEDLEEVDFEFSREPAGDEVDELIEDDTRFARWKRKMDAKNELREFQASGRDPDSKDWEDWLDDTWEQYDVNLAGEDGWYQPAPDWEKDGVPRDPPTKPERGMRRTIKELFFRIFEREEEVADDLQFEERVFRFTSQSTAKFVGVLIVVPWVADFLVHDFLLVPFLNTYVEKVPLAAKVLDVRESQKLRIIDRLKLERQRVRFEAEIGKAPPLSDDELAEHIREEALELREELRLENRLAFANIWSDFTAGLTILLLLVLNKRQVAIMRLTGERLFTNISDTGKAFIIILLTDIFLGYHSESGWETVSEMVLEHYGFEVSQAAIYIFVAIVPVTIDACFKLWVFRFFRTLSPSASATFREMQRH